MGKNLIKVEIDLNDLWAEEFDSVETVINRAILSAVRDEIRKIHKDTIQRYSKEIIKEVVIGNFDEIIKDKQFAKSFWESEKIDAEDFEDFTRKYIKQVYGTKYSFKQKIEELIKEATSKQIGEYIKQSSDVILNVIDGFKTDFNTEISSVLAKRFKVSDLFDRLMQQYMPTVLMLDEEKKK